MRVKTAVVLGVLVAAGGCAGSTTSQEEVPAIRQIVEATNEEIGLCFSDADAGCLAGFFAPDGWQLRSNAPVLVGQPAIQRYWQQNLPGGTWEVYLETQTVEESGPVAIERGKYTMSFTVDPSVPSLRGSSLEKGNYLTHWRLDTSGRWFIVAQALVAEVAGRTSPGQTGRP